MSTCRIWLLTLVTVCYVSSGAFGQFDCLVDDAAFLSSGGGCQDQNSGLVWGPDARVLSSENQTGYGNGSSQTVCDNNLNNSPQGSGFTDWRPATLGEVEEALANGLNSHLDFFQDGSADDGAYRWTACTQKVRGNSGWRWRVRYTDGNAELAISGNALVLCVRGADADPANDCPGKKKGGGKGNNSSLSQTSTAVLLLLPLALVLSFRCVRPRQ